MKQLILILCVLCACVTWAQDSSDVHWKKVRSYAIGETDVWAVDGLENVFISDNGLISKYDSAGVLKFNQSIKSLGDMTALIPLNAMKLVHFSDEQQTLCYLDNTLTLMDNCTELAENDIVYATMVSPSSRPELIWVFDELNAKLVLLPMIEGEFQGQEIGNLTGILDINTVTQIKEVGGQLYVVKQHEGVFLFDAYGSLIEFKPIEGVLKVDAAGSALIALTADEIISYDLQDDSEFRMTLPVTDVTEFAVVDKQFYLRTPNFVHKFTLGLIK